ncbi:MAG: hypothetical protein ACYTF1_07795 [Planctomycetota bacterium]
MISNSRIGYIFTRLARATYWRLAVTIRRLWMCCKAGFLSGSYVVSEALDELVGCEVVLDSAGPMVYLGRLASYDAEGFSLENADVHSRAEGHAPREQYIAESRRHGIRPNRARVYVFRHTVISISALSDVKED